MTAAFTAMAIAQDQAPTPLNLDKLIQVVDKLLGLLRLENDFLAKNDLKAVADLVPQKNQLTADYTKLQQLATDNPSAFTQAEDEKKSIFRTLMTELKKIVEMNERALKIAITAGERVVAHVRNAIQQKRTSVGGYTNEGDYSSKAPTTAPSAALYNKSI